VTVRLVPLPDQVRGQGEELVGGDRRVGIGYPSR